MYQMHPIRYACLLMGSVMLFMPGLTGLIHAQDEGSSVIDVQLLGAKGDGKTDDTSVIQRALNLASDKRLPIRIPAGMYRITQTLTFSTRQARGIKMTGAGSSPWKHWPNASTLMWDGPDEGVLFQSIGMGGCRFENLNFDGQKKAGILFQATTVKGWGNMLNSMNNCHFYDATIGIQMGQLESEHNNSDFAFEFITFKGLKTGMLVNNNQGVDYLFNFIFGLGCDTVLHFERGGNLLVNNAQMTNCKLFLQIDGGGRNAGTYTANNVRIESSDGGVASRFQLVKSHPKFKQAHIKFVGYDDCQWNWQNNRTPQRTVPLCDIGPGSSVVIESSIFNSPVALIKGDVDAPASLITSECSFSYVTPQDAVTANAYGYCKLENNFTSKMMPLADVIKWPQIAPIMLPAEKPTTGIPTP